MTMTPCKDCPTRHPVCHDSCPKYAEYKRQRGAEAAYTREMLDTGKVYHYDYEIGQMKVIIACEESQEVCKAFRAKGHEAYSCDIQEPSGGHPEWHILGDAIKALGGGKS